MIISRTSHILLSCIIYSRYDRTTVSSVLDDKSHLSSTRDKYRAYEVETPWMGYVSEEKAQQLQMEGGVTGMGIEIFDPYNDEYDDTYDSQNVGAADNDSADEIFTIKRWVYACTLIFHTPFHMLILQ